ncbi:MAG: hypothetical protein JSS32_04270 [Verrucomicrobia bacterium]|nr:hypothetical protein [Verrucomicrobiota bacterium]
MQDCTSTSKVELVWPKEDSLKTTDQAGTIGVAVAAVQTNGQVELDADAMQQSADDYLAARCTRAPQGLNEHLCWKIGRFVKGCFCWCCTESH